MIDDIADMMEKKPLNLPEGRLKELAAFTP